MPQRALRYGLAPACRMPLLYGTMPFEKGRVFLQAVNLSGR